MLVSASVFVHPMVKNFFFFNQVTMKKTYFLKVSFRVSLALCLEDVYVLSKLYGLSACPRAL